MATVPCPVCTATIALPADQPGAQIRSNLFAIFFAEINGVLTNVPGPVRISESNPGEFFESK
jgi:hypothetical protein